MTNNTQAYMQFDFIRDGSNTGPLLFTNPMQMITAYHAYDVPACLGQIDDAVEAGFYAAGYMSYEALHPADKADIATPNKLPLLSFGIFKNPEKDVDSVEPGSFQIGQWRMMESKHTYEAHVTKIMQAIQRGDVEEINYTVPFEAAFSGDPFRYYKQLQEAQASKYCAYLAIDGFNILSASPELFFHLEENVITVRPMKGTIHRGLTYEEDLAHQAWLRTSEKNKFENKLTLDLMKQELEEVTVPGSIRVIDPYRVEKYPTVYQMTSGLTGTITPKKSVMEIMTSLFPCGSIAGVPKTAGLRLIHDLESQPREVYCGAIGYITPEKKAVFNVPIRTVWIDRENKLAHYGAGGAITSQSTVEEEYHEVQTKTDVLTRKQPVFELLETIGLYNGDYFLLREHMKRLRQSATYFDIPVSIKAIEDKLEQVRVTNQSGNWRVRLTVNQEGADHLTATPLSQLTTIPSIQIAATPIEKQNCYFYHKTTNRKQYDKHKQGKEDVFDILLWNAEGEITEFTIGNVVAEINGALYTPPVSSGLLPGTFRAKLLQNGTITERRLVKEDINHCQRLWLINSLRKWVEVKLH